MRGAGVLHASRGRAARAAAGANWLVAPGARTGRAQSHTLPTLSTVPSPERTQRPAHSLARLAARALTRSRTRAVTPSLYVARVEAALRTLQTQHLAPLPRSALGARLRRAVAAQALASFCTMVSLVRPLGEAGRLRVAQDMARIEIAMQAIIKVRGRGGQRARRGMARLCVGGVE